MARTTTKAEFPLTVKSGSVRVKVYREEKPSGTYYRLGFYQGGKRTWENYSDPEKAKEAASAKARQLARGEMDAAQITGQDRLIYGRALESLRPLGIALDAAAHEYAEARKELGGYSIKDAARFFMRHHRHGVKSKSVADAVAEMITAKTAKGVSKLYLDDLRYRLGAFQKAFSCDVSALAPDDVRAWMDALRLSVRSYNNFLRTLKTFFTFAQSNGWLSKEVELLASVETRKGKSAPVEIFTPTELSQLLQAASADVAPCIALAAFAGLRSEEILRLEWADLDRRPGFVEIAAHKAKTAQRRLVPLAPNLARWLACAPRKAAHVWPHSKPWFFESLRDSVKAANKAGKKEGARKPTLEWKQNALRHSYISYRLAEMQDVNRVALEAGNSPQIIFQHYRELATPEQAKTWFSIAPADGGKILNMEAAA